MEAKQYAIKQPIEQWRNQIWNKKYLETNENESTMIQNLQNTAKTVLKQKYIAISSKETRKKTQVNNITFHLRQREKEKQNKPKVRRRKKNHKYQSRNKSNTDKNSRKCQWK